MSELKPCPVKLIDANALKRHIERVYLPSDSLTAGVLYDLISTAPPVEMAARAQPTNEPLTLEQLREMRREPVWIDGGYPDGWRICYGKRTRKSHGRDVINFGNGVLQFEDEYGKTWLAYRRPPERSENE